MSKKILVVDDEPKIRQAVKLVLECEGFEVATAKDWQECASKLREEKPDLVLLDILMPEVPGTSILSSITKSHPKTKVVMLSVIQSDFYKQFCRDMGAVDFITKPFENDDLVRRVKKSISLREVSIDITYEKRAEPGDDLSQKTDGLEHKPEEIRRIQMRTISIIKKQLGTENQPSPMVEEYKELIDLVRKDKKSKHQIAKIHRKNN
jgi:DNA-binding response OmpR family regulator